MVQFTIRIEHGVFGSFTANNLMQVPKTAANPPRPRAPTIGLKRKRTVSDPDMHVKPII